MRKQSFSRHPPMILSNLSSPTASIFFKKGKKKERKEKEKNKKKRRLHPKRNFRTESVLAATRENEEREGGKVMSREWRGRTEEGAYATH